MKGSVPNLREKPDMIDEKPNCSGLDLDEDRFDTEFRDIVNALFCACLGAEESRLHKLERELFRLVELQGLSLSAAALTLGLSEPEARDVLAKVRRDIVVLLALGLCSPASARNDVETGNSHCCCTGKPRDLPPS